MTEHYSLPCPEWQKKLAALPADLSPAESAALITHIKICSSCAATFADYQAIRELLADVFAEEDAIELPDWLVQLDLRARLPTLPPRVRHDNLPRLPSHPGRLLGRQRELECLLEQLDSYQPFLAIAGMSGVGKTTLAIEVAHRCLGDPARLPLPLFDCAIWISASARSLENERWLSEILNTIARVLEYPSVAQLSFTEKRARVHELLRIHHTLIILDNFDTIEDSELLNWIQHIPLASKVLVTSRDTRRLHNVWTLHIKGLVGDDALRLIRRHAGKLGLLTIARARSSDLLNLVRVTRGNPQAIAMVLGDAKSRRLSLDQTLDGLYGTGDLLGQLFMRSWDALAGNGGARSVLLAMPFFASSASSSAIKAVAGLVEGQFEHALTRLVELSLLEVSADGSTRSGIRRYGLHPLTRAFVGARLAEQQEWEQPARLRWIAWWLTFTREHGGPDGLEWARQYNHIAREWENLLLVFEWCAAHDHYEDLRAFWSVERLLEMTSIYGYWKERISWLQWLYQASEQCEDRATAVEALAHQGFTLTQRGRVAEADNVFLRAWEWRHYASPGTQLILAENIVQRYIRTNDFMWAEYWLQEADNLLKRFASPQNEHTRRFLTLQYFHGIICVTRRDHKRAESYFRQALAGAQAIGWQRGVVYVQQFLADIARARHRYDEAEALLQEGLQITERNKDWRRTAYYKRSLAYLALWRNRHGKPDDTIHWAQLALDDFARLGMMPEVNRLRHLLRHLKGEITHARSAESRRFIKDARLLMGDLSH